MVALALASVVVVPVTPIDERWVGPLDLTTGVRSAAATSVGEVAAGADLGTASTRAHVERIRRAIAATDADVRRAGPESTVGASAAPAPSPSASPGRVVTTRSTVGHAHAHPGHAHHGNGEQHHELPTAPAPAPPSTTPAPTTTVAAQGVWRAWRVNPDGSPVRYDGCAPIPYVTRLHTGPSFARSELDWAIRQIETASGLDFQWAGDVTAPNSSGWPVHIGFASEDEVFMPSWASGYGESDVEDVGGGFLRYVGGRVILRPDHDWTPGLESRNPLGTMFLHELGHLVGLGHVDSPNEIMTTLGNGTVRALGPGDRRGLAAIGPGGRC